MAVQIIHERPARTISGWLALPPLAAAMPLALIGMMAGAALADIEPEVGLLLSLGSAFVGLLALFCLRGLFVVNPNHTRVLQLFGSYRGTVRETGFRFTNPLYSKRAVSVRARNFESEQLKVNDSDGNPIDIGAIVVWRVSDTAEAVFHVDSYERFVAVQSEAALRNLATHFPYDAHVPGEIALRSHPQEIAERLREEVQARLLQAGVEVIESRISHLAYAPEIASAMLQRQQAAAIVSARETIVEGAVGMVETALHELETRSIVNLDASARAGLASNLLVVLCSDSPAQPVVQTGAAS